MRLTSKFLQTAYGRTIGGALAVFCAAGIGLGIGEMNGRAAQTPLEIRTASLPVASVNFIYSETLKAAGGENPYQWKLAAGRLPNGLTLGTSGALLGTPIDTGTFPITVAVNDTGDPMQTVQRSFSLTVAALNALQVATPALPQAKLSAPYSSILTASGGVAPYKWTAISGNLPSSLIVSPSGTISGEITQPGSYRVVLEVRDSGNPTQTVLKSFNLAVAGAPASAPVMSAVPESSYRFRIVTSGLPPGQASALYSAPLGADGGTPPYRWSLFSNRLPPGLRLEPSGAVTGMPTAPGVYGFTLRATDSSDTPISASQQYQLTIVGGSTAGLPAPGVSAPNGGNGNGAAPALRMVTTSLPDGHVNEAYSAAMTVAGGLQPYAWTLTSGAMPVGLTMQSSKGQIRGAPAALGTFSFVIEVSDSSGQTVSEAYSIVIAALGAGSQ